MFKNVKAFSGFSVLDINEANKFYSEILDIDTKINEMGILELHIHEGIPVIIYPKKDHAPANFTILNFPVSDIDKVVDELLSRGIKFEHYEGYMQTDEKGIFRKGGPLIAWFKDPSGNILSVIETK